MASNLLGDGFFFLNFFFYIYIFLNHDFISIDTQLGTLVPEEPRLAKKLVEPLTHLISTTPAKSLLYECIMTVVAGETTSKSLVQLCLEKLRLFIEDPDQNRTLIAPPALWWSS